MNITMDLSEVLLFLDLLKKKKRNPSLKEFYMMICFLGDYGQVKEFNNKINELNFKPQIKYYNVLIHFIEDYEDCIDLKNNVLQRAKRKRGKSSIFIHQILLSKSREQAVSIIDEAKEYGIEISESWADSFDSLWMIKKDQETLREGIKKNNDFSKIYEEFCEMKTKYFDNLSLKQLKQDLFERQPCSSDTRKTIQTSVFSRSVYIKEFARRVAKGICQLCDNDAPFLDKQGNSFLEIHHIHYLSKGGSDTIDNVVALCPNCHRKIHQLELEEDVNKITEKALGNLNI